MKKKYSLIFVFFLSISLNAQIISFPDVNFKNALVNTLCTDSDNNGSYDADVDTNNDGEIQVSEALLVTSLKVTNNSISNLSGIESFVYLINFDCSNNQIVTANFSTLFNLESLVCNNNSFTTIDLGQTSVTWFICRNNPYLTYFNIKNGIFSQCLLLLMSPSCIDFFNCPALTNICVDEEELNFIYSSTASVNSYCPLLPSTNYNVINGNATLNCGTSNIPISNFKFNVFNGNNGSNTNVFSNPLGNYYYNAYTGSYTVTPIIQNPSYFSVSPTSTPISFTTTGNTQSTNFCVSPIGIHPDLEIVLVPIAPARPGFNATYKLTLKNNGNQIQSGTLTFNFNDAVLDFISAIPTITTNSLNTLTWSFNNLTPFETKIYSITLNVNSPQEIPAVIIGNVLPFTTFITTSQTDDTPNNNTFNFNQTVVGSYDPNDKTCLEGNQIAITDTNKPLHYCVRFQNTGTAAAENVVVKDELNFKLDWSSVQIMASSHPFRSTLTGNKLEFFYDNINLPASIVNEPESHGYIAFSVKPKSNVIINDIITNTANIYFDYNFPIVTNTTSTTVVALNTVAFDSESTFVIYPNPVRNELTIAVENTNAINSITIYNTLGQLVKTVGNQLQNSITISVSELNSGTYFLSIETDKGKSTQKFIKL